MTPKNDIIQLHPWHRFGRPNRVISTAWMGCMPMRLCLIGDDGSYSLGWRVHGVAGAVPEGWFNGDGEALPQRRTDEGDFAEFGRHHGDLRIPAFVGDVPICGIDATDEPAMLLTWLEDEPFQVEDQPLSGLTGEAIHEALGALGWDEQDDQKVLVRIRAAAAHDHPSGIDTNTIDGYLQANYRIHAPFPVELRIGMESTALRRLFQLHGRGTVALLTAWNPQGKQRDDSINAMADAHLVRDLEEFDAPSMTSEGGGGDNGWPVERGHAVFGMGLELAAHLGRVHGQDAIVWAGADAVPKLVLLR